MKPMRRDLIPKDVLLQEYEENVLQVIADKYGVSRTTVHRLLNDYGITRMSLQDRNDVVVRVTQRQREILIGSILGDGSIRNTMPHNKPIYVMGHGHKQHNYVLWKHAELRSLTHFSCPSQNASNKGYYFNTMSLSFIQRMWERWYPDGEKRIPSDVASLLSPMALAVWYMDDGYLARNCDQITLCTDCFPVEDVDTLKDALRDRFDFRSSIRVCHGSGFNPSSSAVYYRLYIGSDDARCFLDLIRRYVPACMAYKVDRSLATTECLGDVKTSVLQSGPGGNVGSAAEMTAPVKGELEA